MTVGPGSSLESFLPVQFSMATVKDFVDLHLVAVGIFSTAIFFFFFLDLNDVELRVDMTVF